MSHPRSPGWEKNNHWCVCDICGFDYRRTEMKTTWDGKTVCSKDFETRHPQELLKVPVDNMSPVGIYTGQPSPTFVEVSAIDPGGNTIPTPTFNMEI